jgi:hypothetical protein
MDTKTSNFDLNYICNYLKDQTTHEHVNTHEVKNILSNRRRNACTTC